MTEPHGGKLRWWKYRQPADRVGPLTWRERFNPSEPKSQRLNIPDKYEGAIGRILFALYAVASWLIGIGAFLWAWLYSIERYGFFLGAGLGWIPSAFIGVLAGVLWPIAAFVFYKWPDLLPKLLQSP